MRETVTDRSRCSQVADLPARTVALGTAEKRYATLDGMRGLAALAVALYHWGLVVRQVAPAGYLAVDFFFGLSGFVIALTYSGRLAATLSAREFMILRLIRFYPIYLVGHVLGFLRSLALLVVGNSSARGGSELMLAAVFGTFMLPVPIEARNLFPLNVPAWTLFLELIVNVAFALGMFRLRDRVLLVIMSASAAALIIFTGPPHFMDVGYSAATLPLGIARVCFSFPLGIILFRRLGTLPRKGSWLALLPICMLVAALAWTPPVLHRGIWELFCVFVLFPGILAAGIRLELPEIIARPFTFLGAISYAVYAIHGPLIIVVNKISEHLGLGEWPAIALYIAVLIMGAQTVVVLFDGPVRKAINSWRRQRQVAAG
jgi:peptidoglycan/LPS O-acetylase OafA/YrhL